MFAYYTAIKHTHILLVAITIAFFNLRYFWQMLLPHKKLPLFFKIAPHLNDTLLFASGIMLAYTVKFIPFVNANWLGIKLILLLFYIGLGFLAIKSPAKSTKSYVGYVLAMSTITLMIYLAMNKPFIQF